MRPTDKLYYLRGLIGFLAGIVSALLSGLEALGLLPYFFLGWIFSIAWAAAFYYLTYRLLRRRRPRGVTKRELAITGVDAYAFMWLFSWTFFYTVLFRA
ncbi:hypothetical protein DRO33_03575 [Candidatus Bathyarchaeota archaeon]|nr:MAG: hypothetical protein DRO33_03575 [Candidatus Bathyarchaeota archaeon]